MSPRVKLTVVFVLALTTSLALARDKKDKGGKQAPAPQAVATKDAPPASGPYSQGIKAGEFVFAAGQVGRDPASGKLVEGGIAEQTDRALKNQSAVLTAAGTSTDNRLRQDERGLRNVLQVESTCAHDRRRR